jgi:F-type H+-transporting ATPase subunit gamma
MQMVSASKMQKAQERAINAYPYAQGIYELVSKFAGNKEFSSVYLKEVTEPKKIAVLVIGTNRGFVGGLIANLTAACYKLSQELVKKYPGVKIVGISLHKTGLKILANAGIKNDYHFSEVLESPTTTDLSSIFSILQDNYVAGNYDEVYVVYSHFINTVVQKPEYKKLLPISLEQLLAEAEVENEKNDKNKKTVEVEQVDPFVFEPGMDEILNRLLPEYFQTEIFTAVLESLASEHSARMIAMKNATDNANELQEKLNLKYNRQRQASITQEIIEVISGAN